MNSWEGWAGAVIAALLGALIGSCVPLAWASWRRRIERRGEVTGMLSELLRVRVQLHALLHDNVAAPLYRLPVAMTAHVLPKLIGDGVLSDNEVYALIEWVNRIEELNRGLERAGAAHAAYHEEAARQEFERNQAKAVEIRDERLERHGDRPLLEATQDVLFRLTEEEEGSPMGPLFRSVRKWLNALGLVLGIIGVAMVWRWGLPQPSFERGTALIVEPNTPLPNGKTATQVDAERAADEAHYKHMAQCGLGLVLLGFVLQFANEVLPQVTDRRE